VSSYPEGTTVVVIPGAPQVTLARQATTRYRRADSANTFFAFDGRFFFSVHSDGSPSPDRWPVELVPADDPGGRLTRVNPEGSGVGAFQELADGRLLVEDWYKDPQRADLVVFDPATGASRVIGEAGGTIAVGARRVLAKLRLAKQAGDL